MSISINTISTFIGIATGIIALIEGIMKLIKLIKSRGISDDPNKTEKTEFAISSIIAVSQWVFLVATTLGLVSIVLATLGAFLGAQGQGDINEQFRNSIGFATAFSLLYGVFWGSVIRPWLINK